MVPMHAHTPSAIRAGCFVVREKNMFLGSNFLFCVWRETFPCLPQKHRRHSVLIQPNVEGMWPSYFRER